jgi:hypothetical protein
MVMTLNLDGTAEPASIPVTQNVGQSSWQRLP